MWFDRPWSQGKIHHTIWSLRILKSEIQFKWQKDLETSRQVQVTQVGALFPKHQRRSDQHLHRVACPKNLHGGECPTGLGTVMSKPGMKPVSHKGNPNIMVSRSPSSWSDDIDNHPPMCVYIYICIYVYMYICVWNAMKLNLAFDDGTNKVSMRRTRWMQPPPRWPCLRCSPPQCQTTGFFGWFWG